jgi:hypothetical protein
LLEAVLPPCVWPVESPFALRGLWAGLRQELQPATPLQELLVEQIAAAYWRLARALRAEAAAAVEELSAWAAERQPEADAQEAALEAVWARQTALSARLGALLRDHQGQTEALRDLLDGAPDAAGVAPQAPQEPRAQAYHQEVQAEVERLRVAREGLRAEAARGAALRAIPPLALAERYGAQIRALQAEIAAALAQLERLQERALPPAGPGEPGAGAAP